MGDGGLEGGRLGPVGRPAGKQRKKRLKGLAEEGRKKSRNKRYEAKKNKTRERCSGKSKRFAMPKKDIII